MMNVAPALADPGAVSTIMTSSPSHLSPSVIPEEESINELHKQQRISSHRHPRMPSRGGSYSPSSSIQNEDVFPNHPNILPSLAPSLKTPPNTKSKTKQLFHKAFGKKPGKPKQKSQHRHSCSDRSSSLGSGYLAASDDYSFTNREEYSTVVSQSASLFRVQWADDHPANASLDDGRPLVPLCQVQEFLRIPAEQKEELWYCSQELQDKLGHEIESNQQQGMDGTSRSSHHGSTTIVMDDSNPTKKRNKEEPDDSCWRGLEHMLEGDDRPRRIRSVVGDILDWQAHAIDSGLEDPEELRVICKAKTKADRTKAQTRGAQDARYVQKLHQMEQRQRQQNVSSSDTSGSLSPPNSGSGMGPKFLLATLQPRLNWSPRPRRKSTRQRIVPGVAAVVESASESVDLPSSEDGNVGSELDRTSLLEE